jgi:Raf kinase inhibitor-like YbhB/YbcL family protein
VTAGSGGGSTQEAAANVDVPNHLTLTSSAFKDGGPIPTPFTCDGGHTSPPLEWRGVPNRARALALVVDDPDAPDGTFVHWVLLDIRPHTSMIAQGAVPDGAVQVAPTAPA